MFDHHIIEHVIDLWDKGRKEGQATLSFHQVARIMETVFLASLKREEERQIQISVALIPPKWNPDPYQPIGNMVLRFQVCLPLTVDSLVKLSPAFDPMTTSLTIAPSQDNPNELEIWGAVFSSHRGQNRFDPLSLHTGPPDALTVTTRKPGTLSIARGSKIMVRFNSGSFTEPTPTPFTASLISWNFLRVVRQHDAFRRYGVRYWHIYRDFIDRLLVECNKRGYGGSVVWIPNHRISQACHLIVARQPLSSAMQCDDERHQEEMEVDSMMVPSKKESAHAPESRIPDHHALNDQACAMEEGTKVIADLCHAMAMQESFAEAQARGDKLPSSRSIDETVLLCKQRIVEYVELLAQLTRVDGALVISEHLCPLSFGSVLTAPHWDHNTIYGPEEDAFSLKQVNLARYGTRHNSAVNFVGKCPDAIAFAISQDGPIAGVTRKDDKTVYWWPDCLSKLWVA